jgi:glycosyltransferase involved in cell wall biosynthesis
VARVLAVDGLRLAGARTAIGRHLEYLSRWWSANDIPFDRVVVYTNRPVEVSGLGTRTPVEFRVVAPRLPNVLWQQVALPLAARRAAVLFCEYTCPVVAPAPPIVVANHGIYEALPQTFSRLQRFRATSVNRPSVHRARRVIANSTNTRDDVVRFFGVDPDRVDIVLPAPAPVFSQPHARDAIDAERVAVLGADVPYVLFVGKFSARRHVAELVDAFAQARTALGSSHRLLLVGPYVTNVEPLALAATLGIAGEVVHLPHLEQDRLALLYAGADLFVLPSEYEGLSWTMLEAMAAGAPVLTVEHPTVDEAADDTVATIEQPATAAIRDAMVDLLGDESRRRALAAAARARAQRFTPEHVASATTEILDRVASDRR